MDKFMSQKLCLQVYTDVKQLRYGHLMIMTDQDHDGSHIKGLIMNYFHHSYPSLLKLPGFLLEFITPIVKACPWPNSKWPLASFKENIRKISRRTVERLASALPKPDAPAQQQPATHHRQRQGTAAAHSTSA